MDFEGRKEREKIKESEVRIEFGKEVVDLFGRVSVWFETLACPYPSTLDHNAIDNASKPSSASHFQKQQGEGGESLTSFFRRWSLT